MGMPQLDLKKSVGYFICFIFFIGIFVWVYSNMIDLYHTKIREDIKAQAVLDFKNFVLKYHKDYSPEEYEQRKQIFIENHYFVSTFRGHKLKLNHMADWSKKELDSILAIKQSYQGDRFVWNNTSPKPVDWTEYLPADVDTLLDQPTAPQSAVE